MDLPPRQQQVLDLTNQGLATRKIAAQLGLSRARVREMQRLLASKGLAPSLVKAPVPDGMTLTKTTVQLAPDGTVEREWRRMAPEIADLEEAVAALEDRVAGKAKPAKAHKGETDLMLELPVADHHMGMLAWGKESGEDYDCERAKALLVGGVASMLAAAGKVQKVALITLGDYYHSDNRQGTTERSGHALDMDSRFSRRVDAGINALAEAVEMAANVANVEVIIMSGNHDWHSAKWLSRVLAAYYSRDNRVTVRTDPRSRQYLRHGKVLLGYNHGDLVKPQDLPQLMAQEAATDWSATTWRRWRLGHIHQRKVLQSRTIYDHPGVLVEYLPTLAAQDAYAHENGFMSSRAMTSYLWSASLGLRAQFERSPEELA